MSDEALRIRDRYARRADPVAAYRMVDPAIYMRVQERERAILRLLGQISTPLSALTVLEVGCGDGGNLLELIRMGADPANLAGIELIPARVDAARHRLPAATAVVAGDATEVAPPAAAFDIVYQSTVFSSILDATTRQRLAARMWALTRPGGAVLWYDFAVDNPRNPDVRGVRDAELRVLFPAARIRRTRVTLAPPIARLVTRVHPSLYAIAAAIPWLRTHRICWIQKP